MLKSKKYKLSDKQYLQSFEDMLLIRRFEEKSSQLYGMSLIGGFCHLYIGQEAVISAVHLSKGKDDSAITSYRCHAGLLLSGMDPKFAMAELLGKATGCSKGKGGSMHLFNTDGKFYGGHGIVGAQVPIGTGIAFAEKYNNTNNICYTFLGDGAVNQGQVYESFNIASLWGLPVLYIIENNQYSMGTSVARSTSLVDLYKKGQSFAIDGTQVDGMDLAEMYNVIKQATEFVRKNQKPYIIEVKTYRYRGHSMSDPATYRTKDEVSHYKTKDPLLLVKDIILKNKIASEEQIKSIEQKIKKKMADVVDYAMNDPLPDPEELYTDIYSK